MSSPPVCRESTRPSAACMHASQTQTQTRAQTERVRKADYSQGRNPVAVASTKANGTNANGKPSCSGTTCFRLCSAPAPAPQPTVAQNSPQRCHANTLIPTTLPLLLANHLKPCVVFLLVSFRAGAIGASAIEERNVTE